MKYCLKLILCACMAIGSLHYAQAEQAKPKEEGGWRSWLGVGEKAPKRRRKQRGRRMEPFMTDRQFYRRAFKKPERMGIGPRHKKMPGMPDKKGRKGGKWGKRHRGFLRKAKMASELNVAMTEKQRQDWDPLATQINSVADRVKAKRDAMLATMEAERDAKKQEREERRKMLKKKLSAMPDSDRLRKEKRQLKRDKRMLKRELFDMARKYIEAPDAEKESIKQQMIEFKKTKIYPLKKKLMEKKHELKMLKFKFYETDAAKPMVMKEVERIIRRAERHKGMWPLRKEYRELTKKLYEIYKVLPWPEEKIPPKLVEPEVEGEKAETLEEAEAIEVIGEEEEEPILDVRKVQRRR